ncbi:MAG TPA: SGNH/GDSL hydrolase family protein [Verrucomicrobiae bacterium]|jgi:phospholipase/lecithinase/hemolysin|nr:SGNH/GDSL hydrolase family protein [Verrucomicrobiae bacterium]
MRSDHLRTTPAVRHTATVRTLILPAILLALLFAATTGRSFTALYVFGDSLSDTGRNPPSGTNASNYFNGRFCNGPLWVEYLSTNLGLPYNPSNNFAISGSTTSDLLTQIAGLPASSNLSSGLFTVVSAGNDFLQNAGLGVNNAAWSNVVSNAVLNISNAVSVLFTNGAREILVGNLANVGQTPSFVGTPVGYSNYVDSKVAVFNTMLASTVTNVMQQHSGLRIYLENNNLAFGIILSNFPAFGFSNDSIGALQDPNLTNKSFTGPGADYVFWDPVHPTTKVDILTAAAAWQSVAVELELAHSGANFNLMATNLFPTLPYTIQSSTNLTTWSNYQTFTATNTNAVFVLTNVPAAKAFYRVGY